ncbi:MAG TPA: hypothetical protein GX529_05780 [Firmicutes bacterium]|nr:hypothetical protein [Candidatus Fermentithermobacillaceae bacterium]
MKQGSASNCDENGYARNVLRYYAAGDNRLLGHPRRSVITGSVVSQDIARIAVFIAVTCGALLETFAPNYNLFKNFFDY